MIEFILIRNPNEILRVKLSKLGFHFQNFIPYKKRPEMGVKFEPKSLVRFTEFDVISLIKTIAKREKSLFLQP